MLWTNQTIPTLHRVALESKRRVRAEYVHTVSQLNDLYEGDHESWMMGGSPSHPDDTVGHIPYFARYFPTAYADGSLTPAYLPLLKKLDETIAAQFHRAPIYVPMRSGSPLSEGDPTHRAVTAMLDTSNFTDALKRLQRYAWLDKTAFAFARPAREGVVLDVLTPDLVSVWESDWDPCSLQEAQAVSHELSARPGTTGAIPERRFVSWTRETDNTVSCRVTDLYGRELPDQALWPVGLQPLTRYPYVVAHDRQPRESIYAPLDDSLLSAQVGIDVLWTDYLLESRMQGGMLNLRLEAQDKPSVIPFSRDRVIVCGKDESAQYVGMPVDFAGMLSFANQYMKTHAVLHGLHPDTLAIDGSAFSSAITAVAKQVDRLDVLETKADYEAYWTRKAKEAFSVLRMVWNAWMPLSDRIPEDVELRIEWPRPLDVADPLHTAQSDQANMNAGLTSPVRILMERKGISEAEATKQVEENLAWKARIDAITGQRQTPDGTGNANG